MIRRLIPALALALVLAACGGSDGPTMLGLPYSDYAHEDEPFAEELYAEHAEGIKTPPDDNLYFVNGYTNGRYTHIEDHVRTTPTSVPGAPVVWFFGGSTMFGVGQRDGHTITAELARLARKAGTPIDARNYGTSGYVAWQEAGLFRRMLETELPPDLVVFLHGVNDWSQVCRHMAAGIDPSARTNPLTDRPLDPGSKPVTDCWADPEAGGRAVARVLDEVMAEVDRYADGVPVVEFWQAAPEARRPHRSDEELLERLDSDRAAWDGRAAVYDAAIAADTDPGIDLTDVFDDDAGPVFFDWAHTNERGARMVAEAMWDRALEAQVQQIS